MNRTVPLLVKVAFIGTLSSPLNIMVERSGMMTSLFFNVPRFATVHESATPALQLFSSLLSVVSLAFLYKTLALRLDRVTVVLLMAATSVGAVFWVWSLEAQVYPLGIVGLAIACWLLLSSEARTRGWGIGAALYPLDRVLTERRKEGPTTEIMICQKPAVASETQQ